MEMEVAVAVRAAAEGQPERSDVLATNLKGLINVVAVDCDAAEGRNLAGQYGIKGIANRIRCCLN